MNKSQTSLYQALDTYVNIKTGVGINGCSVMILDCQTEAKCLFCDDCFVGKPASGTLTIKIGGRKQNGKEKKTENETTA